MIAHVPGGLISHPSSPACTWDFVSKLLSRTRKNVVTEKNIFLKIDMVCLSSSCNQFRKIGKVKP